MTPLIALYLAAIALANLSIAAFGPAAAVYNALIFVAFDLATRDRLHAAWEGRRLWPRMLALIAAGGALSAALAGLLGAAPPDVVARIAGASCLAFMAAGLSDAAVFQAARRWPWLARSNASNVAGALADSLVFGLLLGFPPAVVALQVGAKVAGGAVWSLILEPRQQLQEARS